MEQMKLKICLPGVAHAAETVGDGIVTGTKAVGSGVAAVGDGVVSGVTAVQEATVAAGSAVGSAVGEAVDDSASWAKEKRQSVIRHTTKSAQHTVEEDETLGIIAAKYKTTVEQIIKLNKETLAEGDVEVGMVIRVPVVDRRKSSHKNRSTSDFLSSLSTQFGLEGGEEEECGDATETRCLILSSGGIGPRTVSQGFLILDTDSLILSWGREDPMTIVKEDLANIALVYGAQEQPDFHGQMMEKFDHCGHSFSETEVFPVCEEPELEEDNVAQELPRRQLRAQDSDDLSDDSESGKIGFLACSCFSFPFSLCFQPQLQQPGKVRQRSDEPPVMIINTFALCSSRIQLLMFTPYCLFLNQLPFSSSQKKSFVVITENFLPSRNQPDWSYPP